MSSSLTPDQERFVQSKLQSGKYRSVEEVLAVALQLLEEYDRAETEWVEAVRVKVNAAIAATEQTSPVDGETFVNQVLERFRQARQA